MDVQRTQLVLIILFTQVCASLFGQSADKNENIRKAILKNYNELESYKADLTQEQINNLLPGIWVFQEPKLSGFEIKNSFPIETILSDSSSIFQREFELRNPITFNKEGTYEYADRPMKASSSGKWIFEDTSNTMILEFSRPYYPMDSSMAISLKIPPLLEDKLRIFKLNEDELVLMETYPINNFEKWFYLICYKKKK